MGFVETFTDRERRRMAVGTPKTYVFDSLPKRLRGQIAYLLGDFAYHAHILDDEGGLWYQILARFCRSKGLDFPYHSRVFFNNVVSYVKDHPFDDAIDMVEVCYEYIVGSPRVSDHTVPLQSDEVRMAAKTAVDELNLAFRRAHVGYQFSASQLTRVSNFVLHVEVVEPAIALLHEEAFQGALDEYMSAHRHVRDGNTKPAITDANNAFESTIKTVCAKRGIRLAGNERPDQLVEKVIGVLVPAHLKPHFDGLRSTMKGVTSLRSNTAGAGHGQGEVPKDVGDHLAAYALHMAAVNIVFLIEAWRDLDRRDPRPSSPAGPTEGVADG